MRGRHQFHQALLGRGEEDIKVLDVRVPTPLLEQRENPFGVGAVIFRAHVVGAGGDSSACSCAYWRGWEGRGICFPIAFRARGVGGKAVERGRGSQPRQARVSAETASPTGRAVGGTGLQRALRREQDAARSATSGHQESKHQEPPDKVRAVYRKAID